MRKGTAPKCLTTERSRSVAFKMADGLCAEGTVSNVIEKTLVKDYNGIVKCLDTNVVNDLACDNVKNFYISSDSDKIFEKMCAKGTSEHHEGVIKVPCDNRDDDCRKKRCADRYDSSESSDRYFSFRKLTNTNNKTPRTLR